jgi:hypothetical protein
MTCSLPAVVENVRLVRRIATPLVVAVLVAKKGTLGGSGGLVMADEAMADAVARGIAKAGRGGVSRCASVDPSMDFSWADIIVSMHHHVSASLMGIIGDRPCWLWHHNPGLFGAMELRRARRTIYQGVFHAGVKAAAKLGLRHLPHGLEDRSLFRPTDNSPRRWSCCFIGNAQLHADAAPLIAELQGVLPGFFLGGSGWDRLGLPSVGVVPFHEVPAIMRASTVCLDHVSRAHTDEGMCSTRIFQAVACGATVVSMQDPQTVPPGIREHVIFTNGHAETRDLVIRLQSAPVERARVRRPCKMEGHLVEDRGKEIWAAIAEFVGNAGSGSLSRTY